MNNSTEHDEANRLRRRRRIEEAKRRKRRQIFIRRLAGRLAPPAVCAALLILLLAAGLRLIPRTAAGETHKTLNSVITAEGGTGNTAEGGTGSAEKGIATAEEGETGKTAAGENSGSGGTQGAHSPLQPAGEPETVKYSASVTGDTLELGEEIVSSSAILIDLSDDSVAAGKNADSLISPASMTKILTVLVAAEQVRNLDDTFTITRDITDYSYANDCSSVGFAENETVTVRDLFYGTILASGADAAAGLAAYTAGSREAFTELMNDKLRELGLSETAHFTNSVGLYDENHRCTVYDMAMILEAAVNNDLCREVLSAHTYTTSPTEQHPEGILISNWFLRRIEDKDTGGEVLCAKTGYVAQSGNCAASYFTAANGREYICVTVNAGSAWRCIYDHVALFKQFSGA